MPTAANLNLHGGRDSCVRWHCDDEPLFGEGGGGKSKLMVSVSFGCQALFWWKGKSCPDGEEHLCCLGHGDILVMKSQCQDEFLHCTDPGLEQERINVTCRWIKQHSVSCSLRARVACCLPTWCAGFICCCYEDCWVWRFLGILGAPRSLVQMARSWRCWFYPSHPQDTGYEGVPIAGHALRAEVGGGILNVTLGEFTGLAQKCASGDHGDGRNSIVHCCMC